MIITTSFIKNHSPSIPFVLMIKVQVNAGIKKKVKYV